MRRIIYIILILLGSQTESKAQNIRIHSVHELDSNDSTNKILLLSADWCQICHKSKRLIQESDSISISAGEQVEFYLLKENEQETVLFNGRHFYYEPIGPDTGTHQLIHEFFGETDPVYPTMILLSEDNQLLERKSGYLTEEEWIRWLRRIVTGD